MTLLSILGIGGRAAGHTLTGLSTGATVKLRAEHRDRVTGKVHSHTWQITALVDASRNRCPTDATSVRRHLQRWVDQHSGTCLPDRIAWAEDMARDVEAHMEEDVGREGYQPLFEVRAIVIEREDEGLCALLVK